MSLSKSFPSFLRWSLSKKKKTLQKAKKLFKVSLLSLSKDSLVNFFLGKPLGDVRDVSIFGYPPCWCSTPGEIYICLYAIAVQLLEITMDSSEKERVPSIDELCSKIPILSEYCRKLDDHVKRRYLEKISEVGVDPVTIPGEQFGELHGLRIHYEYSRLHCLRKARCRRKSETFTANE